MLTNHSFVSAIIFTSFDVTVILSEIKLCIQLSKTIM